MSVIAVVNRKGGSGKSTLATHLAAHFANSGVPVMLGDVDRQQSTQSWLRSRSLRDLSKSAPIVGWAVDPKRVLRPPAGVRHVVLDTPGGLRGFDLARVVAFADVILMPVCNSLFDRESAADCYAELMALPRVASGRCKVAAIGMRLDARTKANEVLAAWANKLDLPYIAVLRETQAYVRCIEVGLTLFDVPATQVRTDLAQWRPILEWLEPVLTVQPATTTAPRPILPAPPVAASEPAPVKPLGVTRPVVAPTRPAPRPPSPAPQPVVARPEPVRPAIARPAIGERLGQLLDTLPIPRFLQRNP